MNRLRRRIELADSRSLAAQREHLNRGSIVGAGILDIPAGGDCELELVNPAGTVIEIAAQAVWVGPTGTAFAFRDLSAAERASLERWATEDPPDAEEAPLTSRKDSPVATSGEPITLRERLRGLSNTEQSRVAREGDASERILLERIYGKAVWEPLLRNPRLTQPEVTHLARMGAMPRPLLESIVANLAWLQWAPVRRALLGNPRLATDMVERVLRATPRNELRVIVKQTIYPPALRSVAKQLLGRDDG